MESLSRPQHRRKHSTSMANAFSSFSKNPYDDVLFSGGGGGPGSVGTKLGVQDYAEIFSGSQRGSSIPVLDLSGLEERSGSGDFRSSKLDYSNIFGGFRDEDVAMPYEQLFTGGKTRKTSSDKPRPPAKAGSPLQELSDQLNPSGKKKESSVEVPDQSPDSTKQHFNLSFNKSGPRTNDGSNGKMHVTQLHAVPGFTSFVDGTANLPKTEGNKPVPSLKREVSRAWSFSAEMDKNNSSKSEIPISNGAVKGKAGSRSDELNITDKPSNTEKINNITDKQSNTEKINLKSRDLNELKGARRTRSSSFGSKTDALEKSIGESASPSIFQPSVNEQKGPTRTRSLSFASKADASRKIDGDCSPPCLDEELDVNSDAAASAAALKKAIEQAQESIRIAKEIMERRREFRDGSMGRVKVRTDKKEKSTILKAFERLDPELPEFNEVDRKFSPSPGQKEPDFNAGKIKKEKLPENVEGADENSMTRHSPGSHGLEVNAEGRTVTLGSVQVNNEDNSLHAMNKLVAEIKEIETDEKIFDENEVGVNHIEGLVNVTELGYPGSVLDTSHRVQEVEEIVDEEGERLRIHEDGAMTEEKRNDVDENVNFKEELEIHEEIVNGQEPKLQKLVFDDLVNETQNPPQKGNEEGVVIQDQVERNVESVLECNDEEEEFSLSKEEPNFWFEAEEDPRESPEEGIDDREQRFGGDEEPETDEKNPNCAHAQDEQEMPVAKEHNVIEEKLAETSDYEAAETREMKENTSYEDQKIEASLEAEETDSTLSGTGKSGDNLGMCDFQDVALEKDVDISVDEYGSDSSASVTETREASPVELNDDSVDENQEAVESKEEEFGPTKAAETFSAIEKNEEKEQVEEIFQQEDDELLEKASLLRSASESNFVSSKFQNAFEGLSSDGNTENSSDTDHHEEKLPNDEENATEKNMQDFPEFHDHVETATDIDHRDVKVAVEQSSESDEWSGSISSLENTDELSAHETQVFADNVKDESSSKEGDTDDVDMTDNAMKHDEEQKEGVSSPPREVELNEEPVEAERGTETAQNSENNTENRSSTAEAGDAKEDVRKLEKKDCQQRIEAIRREREKEKERIAVERAIREARERAFAEARERAERAAVERAAAEARQRTMAGAREKLEKATGSCKPSAKQSADKATNEAKLRTERAAVERATAEARERALEKAFSQKTPNEAKAQAEKYSGASRSNTLKHSYSSSDLEKYDGNNTESAQRRKARLERHQRIMERAAKALAEKNMRDILAQREQAERNRLAESLDADIKRWASGKEGNLRALLSTLQYILGPDSGWQPISLTEIITTPAVKKAYRKALFMFILTNCSKRELAFNKSTYAKRFSIFSRRRGTDSTQRRGDQRRCCDCIAEFFML